MEWTGIRFADGPRIEVSTEVLATPQKVWEVVSDPTKVPADGNEVEGVAWAQGHTSGLGAAFVGHNTHPSFGEWDTTSYVVEFEPPNRFSWAVMDVNNPSATWGFVVEADGQGSRLSQWCRLGPGPSGLTQVIESMPDKEEKILFVRMREHEASMQATVDGLKARIEAQVAAGEDKAAGEDNSGTQEGDQ